MISIIIPTFNEEKAIKKTVDQFSGLSIPHEVIVSDSHSTDQTTAIAQECGARVVEIRDGQMRGVSNARNNGAEAAKGDFIVFLDCDDMIPDPNHFFEKALLFFERNPKLVGLSCRIEVEPDLRTTSDWLIFGAMNLWFATLNNISHFGIAAGKFQIVRTDAFRKTGGFGVNLPAGEDIDFFRRLAKVGRTYLTWSLIVYHSGRRFHQLGPWKTLYRWIKNAFWVWIFGKSADGGWQVIR